MNHPSSLKLLGWCLAWAVDQERFRRPCSSCSSSWIFYLLCGINRGLEELLVSRVSLVTPLYIWLNPIWANLKVWEAYENSEGDEWVVLAKEHYSRGTYTQSWTHQQSSISIRLGSILYQASTKFWSCWNQ